MSSDPPLTLAANGREAVKEGCEADKEGENLESLLALDGHLIEYKSWHPTSFAARLS